MFHQNYIYTHILYIYELDILGLLFPFFKPNKTHHDPYNTIIYSSLLNVFFASIKSLHNNPDNEYERNETLSQLSPYILSSRSAAITEHYRFDRVTIDSRSSPERGPR